MLPQYSEEDVSAHNSKGDLWFIYNNSVCDITEFAYQHPGGLKVLTDNAGHRIDDSINSLHVHSEVAYQILQNNVVGTLVPSTSADLNVINDIPLNNLEKIRSISVMRGYKEEELIDWSKPILWQVGNLGENYHDWVHAPVDKPIRLWNSDFLEFFSDCPWFIIPIVWLPVVMLFLYFAEQELSKSDIQFIIESRLSLFVLFVTGILLWSLIEYLLHRFLFHMSPPTSSRLLITLHFVLHGQHHKAPFNSKRLVFPPAPAIPFAVCFYSTFTWLFPSSVAYALLAGLCFGYILYDLTHYYLHHGSPSSMYFKSLKRYHIMHHFTNQNEGFGISSKLWDHAFNTLISNQKLS